MNRKAFKTFAATLATGLGLLGGALPSVAQTPPPPAPAAATGFPGDWPNLGAYNNRQGQNAAPLKFTSGLTNLRYFAPSTRAELDALILDNTDVSTNFVSNGGNFDDPVNNAGRVTSIFSADPVDGWHAPADVTKEASSPYIVAIRAVTAPINTAPRTPSYVYARTTPSAKGAAAYVPTDATKLRYFEWTFTPAAGISRGYGVYTYVPSGQTDTTATGVAVPNRLFPQRYFVYRIFFGPDANNDGIPDRSYTDIVDTELSGTSNFIRLGSAGAPTQVTFPSDGTRIVVRLYNTVPRDSNGVLRMSGATGSLSAAQEQTLANNHLVYADAVQALPQSGSSVASPTASTVTPNGNLNALDATADWRLTIARNITGTDFAGDIATPTIDGTVINYEANPALWPVTAQTTPQEKWRYSVVGSSAAATSVDNASSASTHTPNWTVNNGATVPPANPKHIGADYLTVGALVRPNPDTNPATQPTATATYAPSLANGDYAIYAYIPGNFGTQSYARAVEYQIYEGGTTPSDTVVIDQSQSSGWVRLGSRRYANVRDTDNNVNPAPISVVVTNITDNPGDTSRLVYADAIRFVGSASISVTSTPIHATVAITNAPAAKKDGNGNTKVVVVADEAGKIHCLDLIGNGDGTTTEYWSYPSTPDPTVGDSYADPNLTEGLDGVIDPTIKPIDNQPTAEMPIGFDLSTGAVAHVGTKDLLYIASTNGRVYCIDMSGRGDFDENANKVGTTRRVWSYPSDFPSAVDTATLGSFRGSIVVGETAQTGASAPLVYVPSTQGRIYALDAAGTPAAGGNASSGVTTVAWQFPVADHATLPSIQMTPTLFKPAGGNGRLLFGTVRDSNADTSGQFYCLDATSGDILWQYNGAATQDATDPHDLATTIRHTDADVRTVSGDLTTLGNFTCGVVAVAGTTLDAVPKADHVVGAAPTSVDTVYALNDNLNLYGLKVSDGSLVTYTDAAGLHGYNQPLSVVRAGVSDQSLSYTVITTNSRLGTLKPFPVIATPTTDGSVFLSFARPEDYSPNLDYYATYRDVKGNAQFETAPRSVAAANNFLFALDVLGRLFAYDNLGSAGGNLPPGVDLGLRDGSNLSDPSGRPFRHLHIKLVNPQGYAALRAVDPVDGTGGLTYAQAINTTTYDKTGTGNGTLSNPYAFEWGETAYVLVYGFPYALMNERPSGSGGPQAVAPPQVTVSFNIEGRIARQIAIDSRQFHNPTSSPAVEEDPNGVGYKQDGYAIVPFAFRPSGSSSLPPGNGTITATVASAATGVTTTVTEFIPDVRTSTDSIVHFVMANPLAVVIADPVTGAATGPGIGYSILPTDEQNEVNGTPNLASDPAGTYRSQLQASAGTGNHGGSTTARVYVYDRSLTAIMQEDGIGNVRVQRTNLRRQGGTVGIFRRLSPTLYPTFEDAPVNIPNTSLDYPDIGREQVRAIKDPNGNAENPVASNVTLKVPVADSGAALTQDNYALGAGRRLVPTRLDLTVDIPRYQPPVNTGGMTSVGGADNPNDLLHLRHNSVGAVLDQGYFGRVQVFVDSSGDSRLNTDVREAYRAFNLSAGVSPQLSILVGSPNVDLGSLAAGTGYTTLNPSNNVNGAFNPWTGQWSSVYKPMIVRNDGNVNLIDLRLAKATNDPNVGPGNRPWALTSVDNDPLAWMSAVNLDGSGNLLPGDLWSNIDTTFSLTNPFAPAGSLERRAVILPKPRVTDRVPTELLANPYPRSNPNTGATGKSTAVLDPTKPVSAPKLGVSVPIGFPVGNYATQVRVIENFPLNAPPVDNQILEFIPASNSYEAFSDPITLTYKVRETRMTNRTTPFTAPMIDDPSTFPNGGTGLGTDPYSGKVAFRNAAPAAMRNPAGALYVAWESDRNAAIPSGANPGNASVLYFASLDNGASFSASGTGAPANNAPLWDLGQFTPYSNAQWFKPAPVGAYPSPAQATALFAEGTPVNGTTSFGSPSFPAQGSVNAISNSTYGGSYMAFTGNAQVQTATGRISESKVFATLVSTSGGSLTVGAPVELPSDPQTAKGKPSVLQTPTGAIVFYSETSAGQSSLAYGRIRASDGSRVGPFRLGFGDGFSSVFSPSAVVRRYRGFDAVQKNHFYVELSFAGKLRGRANAEAYIGRIPLDRVGPDNNYQLVSIVNGVRSALEGADARSFALLPQQFNERLVSEGNGQYRARGVQWSRNQTIQLIQTLDGVSTSLVVGNGTVERQSGLIAYDSRLGGKVYLDPELGIVRFAGAFPNRNADIRLTYSPSFLRVTPGGSASYSAINGLFDERAVSVTDYWFSGTGTFTNSTGNLSTGVRNDRFFYAYGRGAAGGITARPYSTTMRFGVRLPTRVATDGQGRILRVRVQGATKPYQVDPANGKIYFQAEDEDNPNIVVTYTGVSEATNAAVAGIQVAAAPSFVLERNEALLPVDEAANDSSVTAFLDPFNFGVGTRPPLVWLFYVSTRGGQPDLYYQTIAPQFTPFAK